MKSTLLSISLLLCLTRIQGQDKKEKFQYRTLLMDLGIDNTWVNDHALSSWASSSGQTPVRMGPTGHVSFSYLSKHFDGGFELVFPNPYRLNYIFIGRRLTPAKSLISSFINIQIGGFDALYNNLKPLNYTPTPDQVGKTLQLQYNSTYLGLSSKNFWSHRFKKEGSWIIGFEIIAGYCPWGGTWNYGYYTDSGKTETFVSNRVYGIPVLGNKFLNIGLIAGFKSK